jgi:hypothetical protein
MVQIYDYFKHPKIDTCSLTIAFVPMTSDRGGGRDWASFDCAQDVDDDDDCDDTDGEGDDDE